jgi:hypothetical protein
MITSQPALRESDKTSAPSPVYGALVVKHPTARRFDGTKATSKTQDSSALRRAVYSALVHGLFSRCLSTGRHLGRKWEIKMAGTEKSSLQRTVGGEAVVTGWQTDQDNPLAAR